MANKNNTPTRYCSFCGRNETQVNFLIPSPDGVYICDYCVDACQELISTNIGPAVDFDSLAPGALPRPKEIKESLDKYVIGQDEAKRHFPLLFIITISAL